MIITKNPELKEQVYNNIRASVTKERAGIHLTDCIYCSRKAYFRKKGLSPEPTEEQCMLWVTGFAFQAYMFPLEQEHPIVVDGVTCSPDISRGIEVKSTRQSSKKFVPEDMVSWRRQILGYCKALNKLEYDLVVLFVTGNYAPPFPNADCWHIAATEEEVDANWEEILQRAEKLRIALATNIPPEPDFMPWEGKYCECLELCSDVPEAQEYLKKRELKEGGK